ncbi:MAG TPA: 2-oxoacid:acceptor oxidoreductase family protein [Bacillota bacterium]|jgi:2-oxoglutarate ferredoxin oxidoreductase subunit gamma
MTDIECIFAGFGGQGVMMMGQLLTYAAGMVEGKKVSYMPAYGPEMRGGTANCTVVISDESVGSPVVTDPNAVVAMNQPSLEKFEPMLKEGGVLIVNSSLIGIKAKRSDVRVYYVPANEIATGLGNDRVANMVALGALVEATEAVKMDSIVESLKKALPPHRHNLIPLNKEALERGAEAVRKTVGQPA